jgi:hypothetical protein
MSPDVDALRVQGPPRERLLPGRATASLLAIALTILIFTKGIVPAMSTLDTDFPNYLTAARIVADGGPANRLYDTPWFQEQMRRYRIGVPSEGKFAPFPPPTALLLVPLAGFQPLDALRIMTLASLACLSGSILLLAKVLSWRTIDAAILVLLSGSAILSGLRFGQPYIVASFCCILGYYAYLKQRPWLAGISFGVFAPIKYFAVPLLVYFAVRKQYWVAFGGVVTILTIVLASIALLGWPLHADFLAILGNHLIGRLDMQDPFTASFQSFDTLFRRLFLFDASANPVPFLAMPGLQTLGVVVTKVSLLSVAIASLVRLARSALAGVAPSVAIIGILTLLLAPATATYHFALLWLPVGLIIDFALRSGAAVCAYFMLGVYALIGVFPYRWTAAFEGRGGLSIVAYPRLWLLLALFIACIYCVWRVPNPVSRSAAPEPAGVAGTGASP